MMATGSPSRWPTSTTCGTNGTWLQITGDGVAWGTGASDTRLADFSVRCLSGLIAWTMILYLSMVNEADVRPQTLPTPTPTPTPARRRHRLTWGYPAHPVLRRKRCPAEPPGRRHRGLRRPDSQSGRRGSCWDLT